ncbi:ABC transporter substrate-binding protein [Liquorilactobacillus satsumensis]|uniref:Family 1 extracellular solute-binding protein n=1 Tax=Liquorilactobacillus satsumensis DSM 16230 = JCM 12392 TaxID=1423801 RepID=A0A0R1UZN6_9LACO|nr:ABC transporter substrate-binding protein [Liquorilactobacillus satsumensis]KRL98759.1 family 1 extracellular solute-binding protein [Liquorilactobacillus satsumensis DSM 16230 = JCM 12392]MCP9328060.1 ABC transporter substrate-binding protein [Liquorilactobacillus satsumensis]
MKSSSLIKRVIGALTLLMVAVLFAGCSSAKGASKKVVHISYWHVNAQTQGGASVDELVKNFNKTHKYIKVTAKYNPNMYQGLMQNLQSAQASGKVPDLVQVGWAYTNYFASNFKYLTPTDAQSKFDNSKTFISKNFTSRTLSFAKDSKNKLVGLPYSLSTPILYYNKTMLAKYGIDASSLSTWEGVSAAAKKIKAASGNYGLYIQEPADTWAQQALQLSNGAQIKKNGKAVFASAAGVKAYQFYQDMVVKDKTALHTPWAQGIDDFVNGKVAIAYTTVAQASHIKKSANFDVEAITSPHFAGHKATVPVGGSMLAITAQKTEQQKAAWTFEKYLYQNSSLVTWSKGTGYLPPTASAMSSQAFKSYLSENPMLKPAASQIKTAVPWTSFPKNGLQAEQTMIDTRDKILSGSNVQTTLKAAQEKINEQQK